MNKATFELPRKSDGGGVRVALCVLEFGASRHTRFVFPLGYTTYTDTATARQAPSSVFFRIDCVLNILFFIFLFAFCFSCVVSFPLSLASPLCWLNSERPD